MTGEEIIDGLEIYTVGRPNRAIVCITVEELQKFIDEIKDLEQESCDELDFVQPHKKISVALDLTQCDLNQLPPINSQESYDDAVSRQVIKEQMIKYGFHAPDMTVTEFIEDLSPANPTKTGHWIEEKPNVYKCSECGAYALEWGGQCLASNYCPNCGAKMIDPQESEDKE